MSKTKKLTLGDFIENPDNPQKVTDEDFKELVKSIEDQPETLAANRIAFVTDYVSPITGENMTGKRVVIAGNKRLRALKQIHGVGKEINPDWFFDMTPLGLEARKKWLLRSNIQTGEWDVAMLLKQYEKTEISSFIGEGALEEILSSLAEESPAQNIAPNQEIATSSFDDEMILKIKLSSKDYEKCVEALRAFNSDDLGLALKGALNV